jgi:LysM repeat protein
MQKTALVLVATVCLTFGHPGQAQTLKGSRASMERQYQEAVNLGYTFMKTSSAVTKFVESGYLVKVDSSNHFELSSVSYPYARPAVKTFIERLGSQYFAACGEKMTVTSLTRPIDKQPANAAQDSVHPTGMAVDLRIPQVGKCRSWLERTLLSLESTDVLDVTRERNPPHYHVAVFPQSYERYVAGVSARPEASTTVASASAVTPSVTPAVMITATAEVETNREYVVRRGDTLSEIATKTGASIAQLRSANRLRGDMLQIGQKLQVPASTSATVAAAPRNSNEVAAVTEVTHRVKRGETLWRIANRYGIPVNDLSRQNGLSDDLLQVGQTLRVSMSVRAP